MDDVLNRERQRYLNEVRIGAEVAQPRTDAAVQRAAVRHPGAGNTRNTTRWKSAAADLAFDYILTGIEKLTEFLS